MMMHHDVNEDIAGSMIMALLDMLHRDLSGDQGGPNWAAWANGNSPYELAIDAICEKFSISYDIEWKANCNDPVGVTIRRKTSIKHEMRAVMKMSEVTSLQQARELKAAGLPLNLKVTTKHWSRKTSELMFVVARAQGKFLDRVMRCSGSDDQRKHAAMIRTYNKFFDAVTALAEWSDELRKTDENEAAALRGVIDQQMAPMLDHFDAVFEQLENGQEVPFQLGMNNTPAVVRS